MIFIILRQNFQSLTQSGDEPELWSKLGEILRMQAPSLLWVKV